MSAPDGTAALLALGGELLAELRGLRADLAGARTFTAPATTTRTGGDGSGARVKFGRDKGKRLDEVGDLSWYRDAIARSADDPSKAKWRGANLDELAEIDAEIARRTGGKPSAEPQWTAPPVDDTDNLPF